MCHRRRAFWDGYVKGTLRDKYRGSELSGSFKLTHEAAVLRRILFPFLPREIAQVFTNPAVATRRLSLAGDVVLHAFLGYLAARFPRLGRRVAAKYSS